MAEEKEETKYDIEEHLSCLNDFYIEVSIALALHKKKKERIGVLQKLLKRTNRQLWPIMMLAVKEGRLKKDKQYKEIFDMLKIEKTRKHGKDE
jgi:hypothetical protein